MQDSNPCTASDPCPVLKSVSSNKSMSYKITVPQICVLLPCRSVSFGIASHSNLCPPKSIFPSDLCPSLWQKNDVIIIAS